ncbi:MAG: hypothetical protein LBU39_01205 [Desulfobulbaceae bacterium]|jgi:hypothetical protein|nr:hypothetical protein [Desulfobulbaceae bacterium]
MNQRDVPQDRISTFAGHKKAVYAIDEQGEYALVETSGWRVEELVTCQALAELAERRQEAYAAWRDGLASPLPWHMYNKKMDVEILARESGLWKWRVRRHFRLRTFLKLSPKILRIYAEVLGISPEELQIVPDESSGNHVLFSACPEILP